MAKYRGFVGQVSPLGGLGITVPGRDAEGITLPGWFESYCVPGSSVRKIVNGYSTCPMIYRGVPATTTPYVAPAYVAKPYKELPEATPVLEPAGPLDVSPADQEIESRQYKEGGDGQAKILETTAKIDEAIKRVTDGNGIPPLTPAPQAAKPNLLPLAIGAGLIWLMS